MAIDRKLASRGLGNIDAIVTNEYRVAFNYERPLEGKAQLDNSAEYLIRLGNQMYTSYIAHEWGHLLDRDVSLAHSDYLFTAGNAIYLFNEQIPLSASIRVTGNVETRTITGVPGCAPYNEPILDNFFPVSGRRLLSGSPFAAERDYQRCLIGYGDIANATTTIAEGQDLRREDWADMFMNWVYDDYPSDRGAGFDKAGHFGARVARRIWMSLYTRRAF